MSERHFKLIKDDGVKLSYEGGYWMSWHNYRLTKMYPERFMIGFDQETKELTLAFSPKFLDLK